MPDRRSLCAFLRVQGHVVDMVSLNMNKYPIDWDKIAREDTLFALRYDSGLNDRDPVDRMLSTL